MTPTFIVDSIDEHQIALRGDGDMPDGMPVREPAPGVGNSAQAASLPGRLWRIASGLFSPVRGKRRRLPPEDDYLRHDIGLPEREIRPQYWDYYWWDR